MRLITTLHYIFFANKHRELFQDYCISKGKGPTKSGGQTQGLNSKLSQIWTCQQNKSNLNPNKFIVEYLYPSLQQRIHKDPKQLDYKQPRTLTSNTFTNPALHCFYDKPLVQENHGVSLTYTDKDKRWTFKIQAECLQ